MALTILLGSPKSGKTRQAYLLAAKVGEKGRVLFFTDDDNTTLADRVSWLRRSTLKLQNFSFDRVFSIPRLEQQIEFLNPDLVIIDCRLGEGVTASQLEKYKTQILLIKNGTLETQ